MDRPVDREVEIMLLVNELAFSIYLVKCVKKEEQKTKGQPLYMGRKANQILV